MLIRHKSLTTILIFSLRRFTLDYRLIFLRRFSRLTSVWCFSGASRFRPPRPDFDPLFAPCQAKPNFFQAKLMYGQVFQTTFRTLKLGPDDSIGIETFLECLISVGKMTDCSKTSFTDGFSNLSNSPFRSLLGWIQRIKLRKVEFDRLENLR